MKKTICVLLAVLICAALAVPAVAANNAFVPSITYKGYPELIKAADAGEEDILACTMVMSVAEAKNSNTEEAKKLVEVYEALNDGSMTLPYDKVDGIDADKMVIRELLEVNMICTHNHKDDLIRLTFDLGVAADAVVVGMAYVNDEWVPAEEVVNNGDGTVTFAFKQLCPIAIAVEG